MKAAPPRVPGSWNPACPAPSLPAPLLSPRAHPLRCAGLWGQAAVPAGSVPALAGGAGQEASSSALPRSVLPWQPPVGAPSTVPLSPPLIQPGSQDAVWIHTPLAVPMWAASSKLPGERAHPACTVGWTRPLSGAQPVPVLAARSTAQPESAQSHQTLPCPAMSGAGGLLDAPGVPTDGKARPTGHRPERKTILPAASACAALRPQAHDLCVLRREVHGAGALIANASHWLAGLVRPHDLPPDKR